MAHDTLYAIGEALIDMIPSKTGCSFAEDVYKRQPSSSGTA